MRLTRRTLFGSRVVVFAMVFSGLAACGGGGDKSPVAADTTLKIRDQAAELRTKAATAFATATDGERMLLGDTVKTNGTGFAQVNYHDGSLTRLDANAQFTLTDLSKAGQAQRVVGKLDGGRAWSRVKKITSSQGRYEIDTPVATASVRGTQFDTDCRAASGSCTFTVVDGVVTVTPKGGKPVDLHAGESLTVHRDETVSRNPTLTPGQLVQDAWIAQHIALDGGDETLGKSSKGLHTDDLVGTFKVTRTITKGNGSLPTGQIYRYTITITCTGSPCSPQSKAWPGLELVGNQIRSTKTFSGSVPCGNGTNGSYKETAAIVLHATAFTERNGRQVPGRLEGTDTLTASDNPCPGGLNQTVTQSMVAVRQD